MRAQFGLFDGVAEAELPQRSPNEWSYSDMQCRFCGKFWARCGSDVVAAPWQRQNRHAHARSGHVYGGTAVS